jgi:hypothetical protein
MTATITPITDAPAKAEPRIAGAQVLNEVHAFLTKYVSFANRAQADAVTLWIVHSHAFDAAETTPRLSIQSAEKQSGKTRLLEVIELLVREPLMTASISAAAMFRLIAEGSTTLLVDEVDTVFSARGKGREDLRGILNAGYRRGSVGHACCWCGRREIPGVCAGRTRRHRTATRHSPRPEHCDPPETARARRDRLETASACCRTRRVHPPHRNHRLGKTKRRRARNHHPARTGRTRRPCARRMGTAHRDRRPRGARLAGSST